MQRLARSSGLFAFAAVLSASGLPTNGVLFAGFLPPKTSARCAFYERHRDFPYTLALYESCHRIDKAVAEIVATLGPTRVICVAKEVTKVHETFWVGPRGRRAGPPCAGQPQGRVRPAHRPRRFPTLAVMPSVAVIDIGSNSIKILVAASAPGGGLTLLKTRTIDARISAGISRTNPLLAETGMAAGLDAIRTLLADAAPFTPARTLLVATSAVRDAQNGPEFRTRVQAATGLTIRPACSCRCGTAAAQS